ncbi:hypothetical protein Sango_0183000 [Sesamum angolense]|uniref:Uncharacterized protein n=1 Tax=Sesamum angolense TaxID=2727404 RepID=A0AAE1XFV7_9LAMI|nr:hypothetical protein Sango_0183000 [Sesamum angolense]
MSRVKLNHQSQLPIPMLNLISFFLQEVPLQGKGKEKEKHKIPRIQLQDLFELATTTSDRKLFGEGSHGLVYKGVLAVAVFVAIKKPRELPKMSLSDNQMKSRNEIDIYLSSRAQIGHLVGFTKMSKIDSVGGAIDMGHSRRLLWIGQFLIRRGLLAIYDPRVVPPKDPMVRKMLAVVAAKCFILEWLANPCLMVETVGVPVQSRSGQPWWRVFRGEDDGFDEAGRQKKGIEFQTGYWGTSNSVMVLVKDRVSKLKPNQSVQESSSTFSGIDDKITASSSVTQAAELAIIA